MTGNCGRALILAFSGVRDCGTCRDWSDNKLLCSTVRREAKQTLNQTEKENNQGVAMALLKFPWLKCRWRNSELKTEAMFAPQRCETLITSYRKFPFCPLTCRTTVRSLLIIKSNSLRSQVLQFCKNDTRTSNSQQKVGIFKNSQFYTFCDYMTKSHAFLNFLH